MNNYILYANGASGNHGCEAITRALIKILDAKGCKILSQNIVEDEKYGISTLADLMDVKVRKDYNLNFFKCYFNYKFRGQKFAVDLYPYLQALGELRLGINRPMAISIGGDNYCYGGANYYGQLDSIFHKKKIHTALVGCSIEPDIINQAGIADDLKKHSAIVARESITCNALMDAGLTNVHLVPDPAFMLDVINKPLPREFQPGNTLGLNLSPLVEELSSGGNIVYRNAINVIEHILRNTSMSICLIPHVVWNHSNDFKILTPLYEKYRDTGRVSLIPDSSAEVLKGYISQCRYMIAARTHASIAAYSTGVPTFVLGYSVKSIGIAKDIFGDETGYVKSTKNFRNDSELIDAFEFLKSKESTIQTQLQSYTSMAIEKLYNLPKLLEI